MMEGLGFDRRSFESPEPTLEPEAAHYRGLLEQVTTEAPWVVGAAVLTLIEEVTRVVFGRSPLIIEAREGLQCGNWQ